MGWYEFKPYVSVATRRANARKEVDALARKGRTISPVSIDGRTIAQTFWGKSWCDHLESYSDFSNRLPRGRTYVRNGSVVDLQIGEGSVTALVSGSSLYTVKIGIKPLATEMWQCIRRDCAGRIGSLIELLKGQFGASVMEIVTRRPGGLFPEPSEIDMDCSCPDWAGMCKHVAATLYGVGARLDHQPQLLFTLRKVNHSDLLDHTGDAQGLARAPTDQTIIADESLGEVFGIELDTPVPAMPAPPDRRSTAAAAAKRGPTSRRARPGGVQPASADRSAGSRPKNKAASKSKPGPAPAKKTKRSRPLPAPSARAGIGGSSKTRGTARGGTRRAEPNAKSSQRTSPKRRSR